MTATAPPLLDPPATPDADLAPLLDDRERACELIGQDDRACHERAVWRLTFRELCDCYDNERSLLLACDRCRRQAEAEVQAAQCMTCLRYLPLLRAEAL